MKTNGTIENAQNLYNNLFLAFDSIKKAHIKIFSMHKLTHPQFSVLETLAKEGPMPLKKLSQKLFVTGANITCVVDNLEKAGFVRRIPSKIDRRIVTAEITPKGKVKFEEVIPNYVESMEQLSTMYEEDEQEKLQELLQKLHNVNAEAV